MVRDSSFIFERAKKIYGKRFNLDASRCFMVGESMGGAITVEIMKKERDKWPGAILVAPMCKIDENLA